jgi:hypothetical protein
MLLVLTVFSPFFLRLFVLLQVGLEVAQALRPCPGC